MGIVSLVLPRQRRRALAFDLPLGPTGSPHPLRHDMVQLCVSEHGNDYGDTGRGEDVRGARDPDPGHSNGGATCAGMVLCVRHDGASILAEEASLAEW